MPAGCSLERSGDWEAGRGLVAFLLPLDDVEDLETGEWVLRSLGGSDSSRLCRLLRIERDCVHHLHASFYSIGGRALGVLEYQAETERLAEAEERILHELGCLGRTGLSEEERESARLGLAFDRRCALQTAEGRAEWVGERTLLFGRSGVLAEQRGRNPADDAERWRGYVDRWMRPEHAFCGRLLPGVAPSGGDERGSA